MAIFQIDEQRGQPGNSNRGESSGDRIRSINAPAIIGPALPRAGDGNVIAPAIQPTKRYKRADTGSSDTDAANVRIKLIPIKSKTITIRRTDGDTGFGQTQKENNLRSESTKQKEAGGVRDSNCRINSENFNDPIFV